MGGKGSGGKRPGAGRPRKSADERQLSGDAGHRGRILPHPSAAQTAGAQKPTAASVPDVDEADAPNDLSLDERRVWLQLAPFALALKTLIPAHAHAFNQLCRNIVLERRFASSVQDAGGASHRGLIVIIDRELLRFGLAPLAPPEPAESADKPQVDPLQEKYFGGGR